MKNIIIIFVSVIAGFCLLEFLTRVLNSAPPAVNYIGSFRLVENPKMMYELIPCSQIEGDVVNEQGFKDKKNFIKEKPKNTIRIAMIGDSITQGSFVPLGKTFSDQLEQLLNQEAVIENSSFKYEGFTWKRREPEPATIQNIALICAEDTFRISS